MITPQQKRDFKELQYKPHIKAVYFSFNGTLRHKSLWLFPVGSIILPAVYITKTEQFDTGTRVNIGTATNYRAIGYGELALAGLGPVSITVSGNLKQALLEQATTIYVSLNQTSSKGKCWGLIEYIDTALLKEIRL